MRIVIDMQGAQTESRFRGIGRYTMAFAQAVVRNRGEHEVFLVLNGLFPQTIERIRSAFDGMLPPENVRVWTAPGPVRDAEPGNESRRDVAERLREAFVAALKPDVVHLTSLFEGYEDNAVTSIGRFGPAAWVSVSLYDLIPLLNPAEYLKPNKSYERYYARKLQDLGRASMYLAISESSREEGVRALGVDPSRVVSVSSAHDRQFRVLALDEERAGRVRAKFGIERPFVLYTGGADKRKNLPRLIQAYAALPAAQRQRHQLVFAGRMADDAVRQYATVAASAGLQVDELIFTDYITDEELVQLYNLCQLYVFPSWHEGFGLPALEAMACGAPVIGANSSSLPEVIGLQDALFDPFDVSAIASKMATALQDDGVRAHLKAHGLKQVQNFSWDVTASKAIRIWEQGRRSLVPPGAFVAAARKPTLAFVSPLPPERTGIADYSDQLLPALAEHYNIELVVAQNAVELGWADGRNRVRDVDWLRANAAHIDRVVYQMGNSPFHRHMLDLVQELPGTVVLHDFYMSALIAWLEQHGGEPTAWSTALYTSHGYAALREKFEQPQDARLKYPVNWTILQNARGVIVHSEYARQLAQQWYGDGASADWKVIPLVRSRAQEIDKVAARQALGVAADEFVVCCFGFLDASKLNHRLLDAWLGSDLSANKLCRLVFVGECPKNEYGNQLLKRIKESGAQRHIQITGFAPTEAYQSWLGAADLAVQLRTDSRGETSAAVLDCMNHGLPVVVNGNGALAELPGDAVHLLSDAFADAALVDALEAFWRDPGRREALGSRARTVIHERHAPDACARRYFDAIEGFHGSGSQMLSGLIGRVATECTIEGDEGLVALAQALESSFPQRQPAKRLFLDVSETAQSDLGTGIQRVAKALLLALIDGPPDGYRIEPVYLSNAGGGWRYCHARNYMLSLIGRAGSVMPDDPVVPENGDVLLVADLSGDRLVAAEQSGLFQWYRGLGVGVYAVVYDLLPIRLPEVFPPTADAQHSKWLQAVSTFDGAVCISKTVADDLVAWREEQGLVMNDRRPYRIGWWHLGANLSNAAPTTGKPPEAESMLTQMRARPSFLMVGTIEPRKGYLQAIDAFTHLWKEGVDVNLVIVGNEGWKGLPASKRRDIPDTVARLRGHPEAGRRLFWVEGCSDEYLEAIYAASSCLLAASLDEGFGLPLIEAAQHRLPMLVRDIAVFREVAGRHAHYFNASTPEGMGDAIVAWLALFQRRAHPESQHMPWQTWKQSAKSLLNVIVGGNWFSTQVSDEIKTKAIDEHLTRIHQARVHLVSTQLPPGDVVLDLGGANCPLFRMGYPHEFKKLYLIDLPPEDRCDMYKEIAVDTVGAWQGEVVVKYGDMTELGAFADQSVDFVWSGQSIEHVSLEAGRRMCQAAYRVLKVGGHFCLDTPNRLVTRIHTQDIGGGFIHPEHCFEYEPAQLRQLLEEAGFTVSVVKGVCEMPSTVNTGVFDYTDFIYGKTLTDKVQDSYIQYFHCVKQ